MTSLLKRQFGSRLLYVGLQGSYLRGEATDSSDIDIMTMIDGLSVYDLNVYRKVNRSLEQFELLQVLDGKNRVVLEHSIALNVGKVYDFAESLELLFTWCQEMLKSI